MLIRIISCYICNVLQAAAGPPRDKSADARAVDELATMAPDDAPAEWLRSVELDSTAARRISESCKTLRDVSLLDEATSTIMAPQPPCILVTLDS